MHCVWIRMGATEGRGTKQLTSRCDILFAVLFRQFGVFGTSFSHLKAVHETPKARADQDHRSQGEETTVSSAGTVLGLEESSRQSEHNSFRHNHGSHYNSEIQ
jgi:hypothetical protein